MVAGFLSSSVPPRGVPCAERRERQAFFRPRWTSGPCPRRPMARLLQIGRLTLNRMTQWRGGAERHNKDEGTTSVGPLPGGRRASPAASGVVELPAPRSRSEQLTHCTPRSWEIHRSGLYRTLCEPACDAYSLKLAATGRRSHAPGTRRGRVIAQCSISTRLLTLTRLLLSGSTRQLRLQPPRPSPRGIGRASTTVPRLGGSVSESAESVNRIRTGGLFLQEHSFEWHHRIWNRRTS